MTAQIRGPIAAKFAGWCLSQGDEIKEGDRIRFISGVGAWHVDCGEPRSLKMYIKEAEEKQVNRSSRFA